MNREAGCASHVPAVASGSVQKPLMAKGFNQARIPNEWRLRVCRGPEEDGRQFLEMITDSFPCLSCLWKREREKDPRLLPHRPFTRHTHTHPNRSFLYHCRPTSREHLAHWIKLALLLFMSGAVPSLALVRLKWERQLSLKLMAGNLQLTSPTAVSSTSFSFSSPFLPFLAFPPFLFCFAVLSSRANQEEAEGNGPLVDKTSTLASFSKIAFPHTSGWRPEGRWRTRCVKLSCFHPGLVEKKNKESLAVGLAFHLPSTLKWQQWNEY